MGAYFTLSSVFCSPQGGLPVHEDRRTRGRTAASPGGGVNGRSLLLQKTTSSITTPLFLLQFHPFLQTISFPPPPPLPHLLLPHLKVVKQLTVLSGQEGDGLPGLAGTPGTSDPGKIWIFRKTEPETPGGEEGHHSPMRVHLDGLGHVVVDHHADVLDIDTPASHVGGHEDVLPSLLQPGQSQLPLLLPLATLT